MKLFTAKSLRASNIAKSIMPEGNNAMTAVAREQNMIEGGVIIAFDQRIFQSFVLQWFTSILELFHPVVTLK